MREILESSNDDWFVDQKFFLQLTCRVHTKYNALSLSLSRFPRLEVFHNFNNIAMIAGGTAESVIN